jgi:malate dehydrogenase (oxaloacetate-decarboxylating)
MQDLRVVISGVGAAGVAIAKILMGAGVPVIIGADSKGAVHTGRGDLNASKQWFAENTNPDGFSGTVGGALAGADVFVGVSAPDVITVEDVATMAKDPIVFAMANPNPEIRPELIQDLAAVIATGRSDFPNQINNVLAFPGIFRGALDARATEITESMKLAAAEAIAMAVSSDDLGPGFIIPSVFDKRVVELVAPAVAAAARAEGKVRA